MTLEEIKKREQELNEDEFIKAFNKAIDTEKQLFIKFIK